MKKEDVKAAARKIDEKADEITDRLFLRAIQSPHTWAVVLCIFVLGVAIGKFVL